MTPAPSLTVHASAVSLAGRGVLIQGASGTGKSVLALALMARGAALVADDRTCLARRGDAVLAWAPEPILGLIEARGLGLLSAEPAPPTAVAVVVDLDTAEPDRLPPARYCEVLGARISLVAGAGNPHLANALVQYLHTMKRITA